jgi:hypothetical protein
MTVTAQMPQSSTRQIEESTHPIALPFMHVSTNSRDQPVPTNQCQCQCQCVLCCVLCEAIQTMRKQVDGYQATTSPPHTSPLPCSRRQRCITISITTSLGHSVAQPPTATTVAVHNNNGKPNMINTSKQRNDVEWPTSNGRPSSSSSSSSEHHLLPACLLLASRSLSPCVSWLSQNWQSCL